MLSLSLPYPDLISIGFPSDLHRLSMVKNPFMWHSRSRRKRLSRAFERQLSLHLSSREVPLEEFLPFLEVHGPSGQHFRVDLTKDRITIGRLDLFNDVALEPDPQHLITRKAHCILERDAAG
jgi:hypothetical protein